LGTVLGIDFGDKRVGIAVSDPDGKVALPLTTLDGSDPARLDAEIEGLVAEREVVRVVVGLPRNMSGTLGERAEATLRFRDRLAERLSVPIDTWDERLTTMQAERIVRTSEGREDRGGRRPRRRKSAKRRTAEGKGAIDRIAAVLILQAYLDRHSAAGGGE